MAKKAVICVFDGMRPDRVSEDLTPNIWRFANDGIWFREARSVFPSVTRVAAASFATGARPETHGIVNNAFFDLSVLGDRPLDTAKYGDFQMAQSQYAGGYVEADGLGCLLARAQKSYAVVHTGSSGTTYLVNHKARANGHWTFSMEGPAATETPEAVDEVVDIFGSIPRSETPKTAEMKYATRVFIDHVLKVRQPDVALIWFCEPDTAYHYRGIGSDPTLGITRAVDSHFGEILQAIAEGPDAEETLIVAMSDHGQISMTSGVDLPDSLSQAGFTASARMDEGVDVLVTHGLNCGLSLVEADPDRLSRLAHALMELPETGMIFSRALTPTQGVVPGTLPHSLVGADHKRSPDLYWLARSSSAADSYGLAGTGAFAPGKSGVPIGCGMHGGLNPRELNSLLAFGGATVKPMGTLPDPADLTDIVPTLLTALGCEVPGFMTGRPLTPVVKEGARDAHEVINVTARHGDFAQNLSLAKMGDRMIPLSGDRM